MDNELSQELTLNQNITLAVVLDQDSLQRVCMAYARMFNTGIVVTDGTGQILVDIPAEYPICRKIGEHPIGPQICGRFEELLRVEHDTTSDQPITKACLCGLEYKILTLRYRGFFLGRLIFGPFRSENMTGFTQELNSLLSSPEANVNSQVLQSATEALAKMEVLTEARIEQAMKVINEVLSVIIQNGYARHLTSQIHIAAIQDAYNELSEKNRRLAESLDKLKELDKLKSNFLATVSHELRTPLTSIMGYSEMLYEGLAGELAQEQRDYLQIVMDKSDQLLQIITKVLDVSRIEAGKVQLLCERLSVPQLLQDVQAAMQAQAQRKSITLNCSAMDSLPMIWVDRTKIQQVLLHLVHNAIKFTPRGGNVSLVAEESQIGKSQQTDNTENINLGLKASAVLIRVEDSGIGIPELSREKIFEAFYQVDNSPTREHGGTGLGLAIVKNFVEAHGGRVWVKSVERVGTTIFVLLPIDPSPATLLSTAPSKP